MTFQNFRFDSRNYFLNIDLYYDEVAKMAPKWPKMAVTEIGHLYGQNLCKNAKMAQLKGKTILPIVAFP